ncbi:MAG: hypothetical protein NT155_04335 [Candidatus Staskawiczbacteria bacterium]|nr:hypothetical protein [Candidatus Staskawiczbacteria bacterium]
MGAGFALFIPDADVEKLWDIPTVYDFGAVHAGHVEEGNKRVIIKPKGLEYLGETLGVR